MSVLYLLWFTYMSMKVCEIFINSSYLINTWKVLLLPFATLSVLTAATVFKVNGNKSSQFFPSFKSQQFANTSEHETYCV